MLRRFERTAGAAPAAGHGLTAHVSHAEPVEDVLCEPTVWALLRLADELREQFRGHPRHARNDLSNHLGLSGFGHSGCRVYSKRTAQPRKRSAQLSIGVRVSLNVEYVTPVLSAT